MPQRIDTKDIVQATVEITEKLQSGKTHIHALKNALGHVLQRDGEWMLVAWERTGTICEVHESELLRLGGWDAGKTPPVVRVG